MFVHSYLQAGNSANFNTTNTMIIRESYIKYKTVGTTERKTLSSPDEVFDYINSFIETKEDYDPEVEHFFVISTNRKNDPISVRIVSKGTATACLVHMREVFKVAIRESAAAIICVHNHPSGDPEPSRADIQLTRQLKEAAKIIGIDLLDHVIIGDKINDPLQVGFYSFRGAGLVG